MYSSFFIVKINLMHGYLGKPQKKVILFAWPGHLEGGGAGYLDKITFFESLKKFPKNVATKLEGGGGGHHLIK